MKYLLQNIKAFCLLLSILNGIAAFVLIHFKLIGIDTLISFVLIQFLIALLYIVVIIYYRWVNEQLSDINQQRQVLNSIKEELTLSFENKFENLKNRIENQKSVTLSIAEGNKDVITQIRYLVKFQQDSDAEIQMALKQLEEHFIELAKESRANLTHELQELFNKQNTSYIKLKELVSKSNIELSQENKALLKDLESSLIEIINQFNNQLESGLNTQTDLISKVNESNENLNKSVDEKFIVVAENQSIAIEKISDQQELSQKQFTLAELLQNSQEKLMELSSSLSSRINSFPLEITGVHEKQLRNTDRFVERKMNATYNRIDALLSIHNLVKLDAPLPVMHEWTISSDFAKLLYETVVIENKKSILDIGSGVSTILLGYALKNNKQGKIISLEHDKMYYLETKRQIKNHQLEEYVDVILCPLIDHKINGKLWKWYDLSLINSKISFDLISIDGPPGALQKLSRYPALPLLQGYISKDATMLLDDGWREEEKIIAEMWQKEFNLKLEFIKTNDGTFKFK